MQIDFTELLYTALRASFVYVFLLIVVRLLGKREIGNTSASFARESPTGFAVPSPIVHSSGKI